MESIGDELAVYECPSCDNIQLAPVPVNCCGDSMREVETTVPIGSPDVEHVMHDIFDISATELDVCRQVMAEDETTINELVDTIDRDRSVITRHLNHLVELGILEKKSRILTEGGRVNVYSHCTEETVNRQLELGLYTWLINAVDVIDDVSAEKIAMMAQNSDEDGTTSEHSQID